MADLRAPTGLARRARRLPEDETEQRMLRTALAVVHRTGLTVSLEHISFEEVIRDADVSRSSAYRRWPHKDLFFIDLVLELARDPAPGIVTSELDLIRRIIAGRLDELAYPQTRRAVVIELFRQLPMLDFETLSSSPGWHTYLALQATFLSLADDGLRDQVQAALAQAEQDHLGRVAQAWERMAGMLGFRLRAESGVTFETLAALVNAAMRGLVMTALTVPDIAGRRIAARPFDASGASEWSLPALGLGAIATAFLEPDPDFTWDAARAAAIRDALTPPDLLPDDQNRAVGEVHDLVGRATSLSQHVHRCRNRVSSVVCSLAHDRRAGLEPYLTFSQMQTPFFTVGKRGQIAGREHRAVGQFRMVHCDGTFATTGRTAGVRVLLCKVPPLG